MRESCLQSLTKPSRAVVAQYNASQLITKREAVSREIRKILTERASNFNIALDDVPITSLSFGKESTHAIEAKQVAAQEAEHAKFIVENEGKDLFPTEKAEQDKRSAIIRAQGEAKSAELIGQDLETFVGVDGVQELEKLLDAVFPISAAAMALPPLSVGGDLGILSTAAGHC
ncbi:hypothetical protein PR202_ga21286 [Eleusine coracana subsp. coracana]|uniref:Prohibitin n=1 Tax=Eleusine coracana subsp. coracana TaxID=191504 RepID=A0AAV5D054_ELECO|nr:hypothetical protein PR202_ga21286 [Eleusine coracana subsp. coracana]